MDVFSIADITNYHKFSSLKKHTIIILQFCRLEVQYRSQVLAELYSFLESLRENSFSIFFQLLNAICVLWLLDLSSSFKASNNVTIPTILLRSHLWPQPRKGLRFWGAMWLDFAPHSWLIQNASWSQSPLQHPFIQGDIFTAYGDLGRGYLWGPLFGLPQDPWG